MNSCDIKVQLVPPRRYNKNPVKSRHRIICIVFLMLRTASPEVLPELLALRAVNTSNDLWGDDLISLFEMTKGSTEPASPIPVSSLPNDIVKSQLKFQAKRKLALASKMNRLFNQYIATGGKKEIYRTIGMDKRGE